MSELRGHGDGPDDPRRPERRASTPDAPGRRGDGPRVRLGDGRVASWTDFELDDEPEPTDAPQPIEDTAPGNADPADHGADGVDEPPLAKDDDTPTQAKPPDGAALLGLDSARLTRMDRFRKKGVEHADDVLQDVKDGGNWVQKFLAQRPPVGHSVTGHPTIKEAPDHLYGLGDAATAAVLTGVLAAEAGRRIYRKYRDREK